MSRGVGADFTPTHGPHAAARMCMREFIARKITLTHVEFTAITVLFESTSTTYCYYCETRILTLTLTLTNPNPNTNPNPKSPSPHCYNRTAVITVSAHCYNNSQ